jgi:integrase
MTPEQARIVAVGLRGDIGKRKNPAEDKRNVRDEMTLGELFQRYLTLHAKKHKRTWKYDEQMFNNYFSCWAERRISTITRREVQTLHARMGVENGECQANRTFAMLRTVYEKGREWGYAGENPCFKLKKFREESRERFLQAEELPRFFEAVQALPEMERDFLSLLLFTGARKSNVLGMNWKDVNMDLKLWNIPAEQSKNRTAYTVPIIGPSFEILSRRKNSDSRSPWVFPSLSKSGHLQEPKRAFKRVVKASKLEDLRPHDLRRTLASWMAITGASEYVIKGALGHKTAGQSVTGIYARLSVDPIRATMETAVRAMLRKGGMISEEESVIEFKASV